MITTVRSYADPAHSWRLTEDEWEVPWPDGRTADLNADYQVAGLEFDHGTLVVSFESATGPRVELTWRDVSSFQLRGEPSLRPGEPHSTGIVGIRLMRMSSAGLQFIVELDWMEVHVVCASFWLPPEPVSPDPHNIQSRQGDVGEGGAPIPGSAVEDLPDTGVPPSGRERIGVLLADNRFAGFVASQPTQLRRKGPLALFDATREVVRWRAALCYTQPWEAWYEDAWDERAPGAQHLHFRGCDFSVHWADGELGEWLSSVVRAT